LQLNNHQRRQRRLTRLNNFLYHHRRHQLQLNTLLTEAQDLQQAKFLRFLLEVGHLNSIHQPPQKLMLSAQQTTR
jgi:hypothetical protein